MSLLREIQDDAARPDCDVTSVLRKCKILSARLGSDELARWVEWELNGYPDEQPTPSYRRLPTSWFGDWLGPGWSQINNHPLPEFLFPEDVRAKIHGIDFREGVAKATSLVSQGARIEEPEIAAALSHNPDVRMTCVRAWRAVAGIDFEQMISAVKNRVLDFVLQIEAENPAAGDAPVNSQPVPKDKLDRIVNNYFGTVGNVAQGSREFKQITNLSSQRSELEKLVEEFNAHLGELSLDPKRRRGAEAQLATLKAQLTDEPDPIVVQQAGRTLRSITEGAIGSLIATAIQPGAWHWIQNTMSSMFGH
jgi:hypothetical protein